MSKRVFTLVSLLAMVGMLLAAWVPASTVPQMAPKAAEEEGGLAVVLTGPWQDHSWNQAGYLAMEALKKKGVRVAFAENVAEGDAPRVIRQFAEQKYKMIVAHSFGFQDAVFQVAQDFPETNFAWAGGIKKTAKNVADYAQDFYEAAYPIGIIAGYMSKTGVLGALYGTEIPVCTNMGQALLAGAKTVNKDAKLIATAVGDWVDPAKSKQAALAQKDAGVDFWIECGEGPALGAIEAAKAKGGFVTGYVGDMTESGPDVVLMNLQWNLVPMFEKMLKDSEDGTFDNPFYQFGIKEGAMLYTFNDKLKDKIPADAIKAAEKVMAEIKDGKFNVQEVLPKN